jgi:hypothetical protein
MPSGVGTEVLFVFIAGCCSMAAAEVWPAMAKRQERMPTFMLIRYNYWINCQKSIIFK